MYDHHIHMNWKKEYFPADFLEKTLACGVTGGAILSPHPAGYCREENVSQCWERALETVLEFTSQTPGFLPVLWIDPTDPDIMKQISSAIGRGIAGFKVICNHFYPHDVMNVWHAIAETGYPVIFHSGILYSTEPAAKFNRPQEFECLMKVPGLRFSMAHAGWPWVDEYISIAGEFNWENNHVDMYIDLTPGTPAVYRRETLRKICFTLRNCKNRILWGSDSYADCYRPSYTDFYRELDKKIFREIAEEDRAGEFKVPCWNNPPLDDVWEFVSEKNFPAFFHRDPLE